MKKIYRINKNYLRRVIFYVLILFPFIQQRTLSELQLWVSSMYKYYTIFSSTVIYLFIIFKRKFYILKNKQWLFFLYWCINLVSTILYAPSQIYYVLHMAYIMIALVLFMYYIKYYIFMFSFVWGNFQCYS